MDGRCCLRICARSQLDRGHGSRNDEPNRKPNRPYGLSRSLLAPYLCIAVIYIGSGVVEGDVQELESSLHLRLSKL